MSFTIRAGFVLLSLAIPACVGAEHDDSDGAEPVGTTAAALGTCNRPYIQGGMGLLTPGSTVLILGCGFGPSQGAGQAAIVFSSFKAHLPVSYWSDGAVKVTIPAFEGVYDQNVSLQITTNSGYTVTSDPSPFTAARETVVLSLADFKNNCEAHGSVDDDCTGTHVSHKEQNPSPGYIVPIPFTDEFKIQLKPGWVYESHTLSSADSGADGPIFPVCINGGVGPRPKVDSVVLLNENVWFGVKNVLTGCGSWDSYRLEVRVTGPKGTQTH